MHDKLVQLYDFLINNGYVEDAKRIKELMDEVSNGATEMTKKRLVAMCNPRYLGNLNIKEFDNVYKWWNFLSSISEDAKKMN